MIGRSLIAEKLQLSLSDTNDSAEVPMEEARDRPIQEIDVDQLSTTAIRYRRLAPDIFPPSILGP
jgi:hypothetical protein